MNALVRPLAVILGIALLAAGALGFFMNPVLVFSVNTLHNIVHLASGALALIAVGAGYGAARLYLIVFGLVYALVTIAGFIKLQQVVQLLHLNTADNFLHLAIAAACLVVGFGSKRA
jgi:hypothetical protein